MRVRVVSFDMEGTLVDHSFSNRIWETDIPALYAEAHGLGPGEAHDRVISQYMEVGEGRPEWYDVGYWWRRLDLPGDWRTLLAQRRDVCHVYPEVPEVLTRLRDRYHLIVCSNTITDFLEVQLSCVDGHFLRVYSAPSDFGAVKNSPAFYRRVCDDLLIEPTEMAHVGDHAEFDYKASKQLGVRAFHLDRSGELNGPDVVRNLIEFADRLEA